MSGWPFGRRDAQLTASDLLGFRTQDRTSTKNVSRETALKHSAVWAALVLRADMESSMPVDVYRRVGGVQVDMPKPPVIEAPGGSKCDWMEHCYSSRIDLDSVGNSVGIIKARDGAGNPALIELVPISDVSVQVRKGVVSYRVAGELLDTANVWHEKQYTMSGVPVGLSPIAYAAASLNGYLSAQAFAQQWFDNSGVPAAHLKNTARKLTDDQATSTKARFSAAMRTGDVFVTGNDWDYNMISAKASEAMFLEERRFGLGDACRYIGVPGDMIDVNESSSTVTYANITQRNLQFLILKLGPAITRRENAWSKIMPKPRYLKLNTDAILRMDIAGRYAGYALGIGHRFLAPSEVRELENREPFTPEQIAEFELLNVPKPPAPKTTPIGEPA